MKKKNVETKRKKDKPQNPAKQDKQAKKLLKPSESQYRILADQMKNQIWIMDLDLNITYINPSVEKLLGYTSKELKKLPLDKLLPPESYQVATKFLSVELPKALKASPNYVLARTLEIEFHCKNGQTVWGECTFSFIWDENDKLLSILGEGRDITRRKQIEKSLQMSEENFRHSLDDSPLGVRIVKIEGETIYANRAILNMYGYESIEELKNTPLKERYTPESYDEYQMRKKQRLRGETGPSEYDVSIIRKNREVRHLHVFRKEIFWNGKKQFQIIYQDITERRQAEFQREAAREALRHSEEKYRSILENIEDGYYEVDIAGDYTFFNDSMCRLCGYSKEEMMGMNYRRYTDKKHSKKLYQAFNKVYLTGKPAKGFGWQIIRKDGSKRYIEASVSLLKDSSGKVTGFRGITRDITERKQMEQELDYMATHDALTGLPNRLLFTQLLNHAIQSAQRHKRQLAVFFIDLDRFKNINDTLGHKAGDQLLQEMATRFKQLVRNVDIVGRLGGDEFVMLIEEIKDSEHVSTLAHKILNTVIKPVVVEGEECRVTTSIGISLYPQDGETEQALMKNADMAMYFAKEEGRNNYQFYAKNIQIKAFERFSIESNLRRALERNELYLDYQAKLDLKTGVITGVEALLRWNNPSLGSITPTQFIPVAEETGMIVPIGRWVLKTACAQNVAWQRQGLSPVCMAVNLSLRQLTDNDLLKDIKAALDESGMDSNLLELEITESMVMHNPTRFIGVLNKIKDMGVRLAIDDFGTGYSSLAQIKHFPINTLKVDRSFIRNLPQDADDQAITEAIINMGKTLSLTVVAEGVENLDQDGFLREKICDEMQGFYFSRPISPDEFADLLRKHNVPH
ncbi:MAG: EAL domain-containing protein [Syntrophaceae bacterium]|nr:EAL domain-containing protein [Syntrophaceae bacterium]